MKLKQTLLLLAAAAMTACCCSDKATKDYYADLPFDMPKVQLPSIPDREVCLTDFGAVGDGMSLCTEAFAAAIDHLAEQGGGTVNIPDGIWFTGPIVMKDNIEQCRECEWRRLCNFGCRAEALGQGHGIEGLDDRVCTFFREGYYDRFRKIAEDHGLEVQ